LQSLSLEEERRDGEVRMSRRDDNEELVVCSKVPLFALSPLALVDNRPRSSFTDMSRPQRESDWGVSEWERMEEEEIPSSSTAIPSPPPPPAPVSALLESFKFFERASNIYGNPIPKLPATAPPKAVAMEACSRLAPSELSTDIRADISEPRAQGKRAKRSTWEPT